MISWNLLLLIGCVLGAWLLYNEARRRRRNHLLARLVFSVLAVASLGAMAYPYVKNNRAVKKIIVLTDGFVKDSVNRFLQNNKNVVVFSTIADKKNLFPGQPVLPVTDWKVLSDAYPASTIDVFGNDFNNDALKALHPRPIGFHFTPIVSAITHVYWKQHLAAGETLNVQGHYYNNSGHKIKLALQAFGAIKDTTVVDAGQQKDFTLQTVPLHAGNATYTLLVIEQNDTIRQEPVPVSVDRSAPVNLLIISAAPDFENTYLKNFLSQQGYPVTVNTVVSTNKNNQQFLNTPVQKNNLFSAAYLDKFDVLLTDAETLRNMTRAKRTIIASAVSVAGAGLLVKTDTTEKAEDFYASSFPVKTLGKKQPTVILHEAVSDSNRYKIKITEPEYIVLKNGTQPLLLDAQSNAFAAATQYGNGKIIATTLSNTYSMALAGDNDAYRRLWSLLLGKASKRAFPTASWLMDPFIPYINKPVHIQAIADGAILQQAVIQGAHMYLQPDRGLPFQYNGRYWPSAAGWQYIALPGDSSYGWYAYEEHDWKSVAQYANRQQALQYMKRHPVAAKESATATFSGINWPLLMVCLFLACCIFLWVEQKKG
jgi:hypothetical protein